MPSPGTVPPSDETFKYPNHVRFQHSALMNGLDPDTSVFADYDSSFTMADALIEASRDVGGSPYENAAAFDPDADLAKVQTEVDDFNAIVEARSASTDQSSAVTAAIAKYDTDIQPTSGINATVDAVKDLSKAQHLADVGNAHAGFHDVRGSLSSQLPVSVALMEQNRGIRVAEEEQKLRLFFDRQRTEGILRLTEQYLSEHRTNAAFAERVAGIQEAVSRNKIIAQSDQIEYDLQIEAKDALWDLEIFAYGFAGGSSITGTASVPRAQTGRERVMSAAMSSLSMGFQGGQAIGSPAAGLAIGTFSLLAQLYGLSPNA